MVEDADVEAKMCALAEVVDPELRTFTSIQGAVYDLAHALRDDFTAPWRPAKQLRG